MSGLRQFAARCSALPRSGLFTRRVDTPERAGGPLQLKREDDQDQALYLSRADQASFANCETVPDHHGVESRRQLMEPVIRRTHEGRAGCWK